MSPYGGGGHPQYLFLAQIYQGLKSLGNGLCTLTKWPQNVICVHTCMHSALMCGIWDWQSMIIKDLNDSQDPQHTLFWRENAFVAIYTPFSDIKWGTMSPILFFNEFFSSSYYLVFGFVLFMGAQYIFKMKFYWKRNIVVVPYQILWDQFDFEVQ